MNQLENILIALLILQHKSHPAAKDENSVLRWHRYTSMQMSSRKKKRRAFCPPCLFVSSDVCNAYKLIQVTLSPLSDDR